MYLFHNTLVCGRHILLYIIFRIVYRSFIILLYHALKHTEACFANIWITECPIVPDVLDSCRPIRFLTSGLNINATVYMEVLNTVAKNVMHWNDPVGFCWLAKGLRWTKSWRIDYLITNKWSSIDVLICPWTSGASLLGKTKRKLHKTKNLPKTAITDGLSNKIKNHMILLLSLFFFKL